MNGFVGLKSHMFPLCDALFIYCICKMANWLSDIHRLFQTVSHDEALRLVAVEEEGFTTMAAIDGGTDASKMVEAVSEYLSYLRAQWLPHAMWSGWSRCGRKDASVQMGVGPEVILTTTNHLESLNGRLKNYYIP